MAISELTRNVASGYLQTELKPLNIIEFAESPQGLDMTLYPMQKFIFKVFYRLPLSEDINENKIVIRDDFNDKILAELTERQTIDYLYTKRMINVTWEDVYVNQIPLNDIQFYIGRRGTKTKMFVIVSAFSLYELLFKDDPHRLFNNKPVTDEISITLVSNKLSGANRMYRELTGALRKSKFFQPFIAGDSKDGFWLKTKAFIKLENAGLTKNLGNIRVSASAANYGVRGDANIMGGLDEYAHYMDSENNDNKDKPLDVAMYEALAPSTFEFNGTDGKSYGKMFILSSPNGKRGNAYKKYEESFTTKSTLMLNMPSFYVNIHLGTKQLKDMYNESSASYEQEILGKFTAKVSKWVGNGDVILSGQNMSNYNIMGEHVHPSMTYYLGVDFALSGDGAAFCVAHTEPSLPQDFVPYKPEAMNIISQTGEYIIIDYIQMIQAEPGKDLDLENLIKFTAKLCKTYNIRKGAYDQWSRATVEKYMRQYGINKVLECINATEINNNDMARIYKKTMLEGKLIVPNDKYTLPQQARDWNTTYLDEVFQLNEYSKRSGMIKVENPYGHDDRYKAAEKAVYLAYTKAAPAIGSIYDGQSFASNRTSGMGVPSAIGGGIERGASVRNFINKRDMTKVSMN